MPSLLRLLSRLLKREQTTINEASLDCAAVSRTPEGYYIALTDACVSAGNWSLDWNRRFRSALLAQGLMLATAVSPWHDCSGYPEGQPILAPLACEGPDSWPGSTVVLWRPAVEPAAVCAR